MKIEIRKEVTRIGHFQTTVKVVPEKKGDEDFCPFDSEKPWDINLPITLESVVAIKRRPSREITLHTYVLEDMEHQAEALIKQLMDVYPKWEESLRAKASRVQELEPSWRGSEVISLDE